MCSASGQSLRHPGAADGWQSACNCDGRVHAIVMAECMHCDELGCVRHSVFIPALLGLYYYHYYMVYSAMSFLHSLGYMASPWHVSHPTLQPSMLLPGRHHDARRLLYELHPSDCRTPATARSVLYKDLARPRVNGATESVCWVQAA